MNQNGLSDETDAAGLCLLLISNINFTDGASSKWVWQINSVFIHVSRYCVGKLPSAVTETDLAGTISSHSDSSEHNTNEQTNSQQQIKLSQGSWFNQMKDKGVTRVD